MQEEIQRLKERIAELEERYRIAQAASEAKSNFLAHTSHEIRTPLNTIVGYCEMILDEMDEKSPEEVKEDLKKIHLAALHLMALINSVLDLSKIEAGKMEVVHESFDLESLMIELVGLIEPLAMHNENRVSVHYHNITGSIITDRTKLKEILFNVLSNSCKFTHRGEISLIVEATSDQKWVEIHVKDTGEGMSARELSRLFHPYEQTLSGKESKKGTGLGLLLCKKLCELMGGTIFIESTPGEGTTVHVRLPLIREEGREAAFAPPYQSNIILTIDDDEEAQKILTHQLNQAGFEVVAAFSGEEGLRLAKEKHPLAITLDVFMPKMDGWEVLSKLKEDPELKDIPVIMLTVSDERRKALAFNVKNFLTKPVSAPSLISLLSRYKNGKQCVLIVDDDKESRELLKRKIVKEGWETLEAANGMEALALLEKYEPNLILLDLIMPKMSGFDLVRACQRHEKWKDIPIVILTGASLTAEERSFLAGYTEAVVAKGVDECNFLDGVIRHIKEVSHAKDLASRR